MSPDAGPFLNEAAASWSSSPTPSGFSSTLPVAPSAAVLPPAAASSRFESSSMMLLRESSFWTISDGFADGFKSKLNLELVPADVGVAL